MIIEWRRVPGFPEYEVSNTGLIRSYKWKNRGPDAPHTLRPMERSDGRQTVILRRNKKNHSYGVGRLILLAFVGPCPDGCETCHNDGNPANNYLDNLRWDTHLANMADAKRHGTLNCRLTFSQAEEIRNEYSHNSTTLRKLAEKYSVSHNTIHLIVMGKIHSQPIT